MKKHIIRIIISLQVIIIILLLVDTINWKILPNISIPIIIIDILQNAYFTNIVCSIIVVILLYSFQIKYCKSKLVKDFRFQEAFSDLYDTCEETKEVMKKLQLTDNDYITFYKENQKELEIIHDLFLYPNNVIIWDSISTVFFLNINFKLLGIINNIKNRLPTMDDWWKAINKKDGKIEAYNIRFFCGDLTFLTEYCDELFKYFKFDLTLQKTISKYLPEDISGFMNLPVIQRNKIYKEALRKAKKKLRKSNKL